MHGTGVQTAKVTGVSNSRTSYTLETGRAQRDTETWQGREVIEKKKAREGLSWRAMT